MRGSADALVAELRGAVADERVLSAVRSVPRDKFVPADLRAEAWENIPLPIGCGQTISQPLVVARMCELLELRGDERVLDVGTGSGYHAALLSRLAAHVYSIELHPELSERAAECLAAAGVVNVTLVVGDGCAGLPEHAPFDAINVAAAAAGRVPPALVAQLGPRGRLVAPVDDGDQRLVLLRRQGDAMLRTELERVRFVPLVPISRG
jgi:protein-L-isoaspartate(D-aspartate) O-methyltransferase